MGDTALPKSPAPNAYDYLVSMTGITLQAYREEMALMDGGVTMKNLALNGLDPPASP